MTNKVLSTLMALSIFEDIPEDKLRTVADHMSTRNAAKGEVIISEGDIGDEMFVLLEGSVRIGKRTLDNEEYTVTELHAADTPFFGELALLDSEKRSATITALEPCVLLVLKREDFEALGNRDTEMALRITRHLARRVSQKLRDTNEDVILLFEALVTEVRAKEVG